MDLYEEVIHHHEDGSGVYALEGEPVFLWFYAGNGEEDDQMDDAGYLQDVVPCSCLVRL